MPDISCKLVVLIMLFSAQLCRAVSFCAGDATDCRIAFLLKTGEAKPADTILVCNEKNQVQVFYSARLKMAVCDDKLCAILLLKIRWDLAGNYVRFDTIPGIPLTKFDHKPFTGADYKKLDQILKDKNSTLRMLEKEDLVDKNNLIKATTVDAVTGATPATIKNAVVEGAVYSSYTLWHYVHGMVKDSIRAFTDRIYSEQIALQMLRSENYETQLFALKKFTSDDYRKYFNETCQAISASVPLVRAYMIGRLPLPFQEPERNHQLVLLFKSLDDYSKSAWIDRITGDEKLAAAFLPLMVVHRKILDQRQLELILGAVKRYNIHGCSELINK
jgi:hypothetical protein